MLRVCFVIEDFLPIVNGTTVQIVALAERLARCGAKVTILSRKITSGQEYGEELRGIRVIRVGPALGARRIAKYVMILPVWLALVRERRHYDQVIVCDLKVLGVPAVLAAGMLGKRCLLRAESCGELDGSFATQYGPPPPLCKRALIAGLVRLRNALLLSAEAFLAVSSAIQREFLACGVAPAKIVAIPNGIDTHRFRPLSPEAREQLRRDMALEGQRVVVYTGRLARGKGLEHLLRAWQRLASEEDGLRLLLVGSGQGFALACEDALKEYVREHRLHDAVTFVGNVPDVAAYLQAADCFVLPSQVESFSLSLAEALSCGLPCVATAVGGILDLVVQRHSGLLVPYGDEEALATAVRELLGDVALARRLGAAARQEMTRHFDIDHVADAYRTLLERT